MAKIIQLNHADSKVTITPVIIDTADSDAVVGKGTPQEVTLQELADMLATLLPEEGGEEGGGGG